MRPFQGSDPSLKQRSRKSLTFTGVWPGALRRPAMASGRGFRLGARRVGSPKWP